MEAQQATAPRMVTQIPVPAQARALATLSRIDYADAFRVDLGASLECSAEQWARVTLAQAPPLVRAKLVLGWTGLGLRLGSPRSPRHVLGWPVQSNDPGHVVLAARSWLGLPAELLFLPEPSGVLFATFVRQDNPAVQSLWARVTPTHERVVRSLLSDAARRIAGGG